MGIYIYAGDQDVIHGRAREYQFQTKDKCFIVLLYEYIRAYVRIRKSEPSKISDAYIRRELNFIRTW